MKFLLEHDLPKRLRYAKVYFEAGSAKVFFALDGASADWTASIGKRRRAVEMSDSQYARYRRNHPAVQTLDDDGRMLVVKNAAGFEEQWRKPTWVLTGVRRKGSGSK